MTTKLTPFEYGKAAQDAGLGPFPFADDEFVAAHIDVDAQVGNQDNLRALRRWQDGWTAARLAACDAADAGEDDL